MDVVFGSVQLPSPVCFPPYKVCIERSKTIEKRGLCPNVIAHELRMGVWANFVKKNEAKRQPVRSEVRKHSSYTICHGGGSLQQYSSPTRNAVV